MQKIILKNYLISKKVIFSEFSINFENNVFEKKKLLAIRNNF